MSTISFLDVFVFVFVTLTKSMCCRHHQLFVTVFVFVNTGFRTYVLWTPPSSVMQIAGEGISIFGCSFLDVFVIVFVFVTKA